MHAEIEVRASVGSESHPGSTISASDIASLASALGISLPIATKADIRKAHKLEAEVEVGNREYKFKLTGLSDEQLTHRTTQLNWRLNEGNGIAFYQLGVEDNGNPLGLTYEELRESLLNLKFMADDRGCEMEVCQLLAGERGLTAEVRMRRRERLTVSTAQVMVAVAGNENSGKSTLIGVLSSGKRDNGKGLARAQVFTHDHEISTGRTSSISYNSLHFNKMGEILNADSSLGFISANFPLQSRHNKPPTRRLRALSNAELVDETDRNVILVDLAGHSKYFKTTLRGLVGRRPNHNLVCVSAVDGLQSMTIEHIGVSLYLKVPLAIIITKIDCLESKTAAVAQRGKNGKKQRANCYSSSATEVTVNGAQHDSNNSSSSGGSSYLAGTSQMPVQVETLLRSIQQLLAGTKREARLITNAEQLSDLMDEQSDLIDATTSAVAASPHDPAEIAAAEKVNEESQSQLQPVKLVRGSSTSSTASTLDSKLPVPVFVTSNVTGEGLPLVVSYLYNLPSHQAQQRSLSREQPLRVRIMGSMGRIDDEEEATSLPSMQQQAPPQSSPKSRQAGDAAVKFNQQTPLWRFTQAKAAAAAAEQQQQVVQLQQQFQQQLQLDNVTPIAASTSSVAEQPPDVVVEQTAADSLTTQTVVVNDAELVNNVISVSLTRRPSNAIGSNNEFSDFVEPVIEPTINSNEQQSGNFSRNTSTNSFISRTSNGTTGSMNSSNIDPQNSTDSPTAHSAHMSSIKGRKVLIGSIECGRIAMGDRLLLGPTSVGTYMPVMVASLRVNDVEVQYAAACQTVTFKLTELPPSEVREIIGSRRTISNSAADRTEAAAASNYGVAMQLEQQPASNKRGSAAGLTLLSLLEIGGALSTPPCYWEFDAELLVLNHPSKVRINYEPVVHISCIRQTAKVVRITRISTSDPESVSPDTSQHEGDGESDTSTVAKGVDDNVDGESSGTAAAVSAATDADPEQVAIGNGERALCRFRFLYYPEYILPGEAMIIREQSTRGVGTVTAVW